MNRPRAVWLMIPAALVDATLNDLAAKLDADDVLIDGGNSYYIDDIRRARELKERKTFITLTSASAAVCGASNAATAR